MGRAIFRRSKPVLNIALTFVMMKSVYLNTLRSPRSMTTESTSMSFRRFGSLRCLSMSRPKTKFMTMENIIRKTYLGSPHA